MIALTLPFPPSTNNLFINVGKFRVVSKRYKAWREEAGVALKAQQPNRLGGYYTLGLTLHPPTRAARDLDNFIKAVSDLLVAHDVIQGDQFATRITVEWSDLPPKKPGSVRIALEAAA